MMKTLYRQRFKHATLTDIYDMFLKFSLLQCMFDHLRKQSLTVTSNQDIHMLRCFQIAMALCITADNGNDRLRITGMRLMDPLTALTGSCVCHSTGIDYVNIRFFFKRHFLVAFIQQRLYISF